MIKLETELYGRDIKAFIAKPLLRLLGLSKRRRGYGGGDFDDNDGGGDDGDGSD